MLVQKGRLAPIDEKTPLVQTRTAVSSSEAGALFTASRSIRAFAMPRPAKWKAFDTRFFFDDQGGNVSMDE